MNDFGCLIVTDGQKEEKLYFYMVMTRFKQTLESYLSSTDFIEPCEVLEFGIQLLKAIEIVHESGSTYNDLNLNNIMIQGD